VLRGWQCLVTLSVVFGLPGGPLWGQPDSLPPVDVIEHYRQARLATMQAGVTEASVRSVAALLADSVLYEHPAVEPLPT
jgi:hypothetical protein